MKNIVDKFITSWDIKLKETNLQIVNIKSPVEFPSLKQVAKLNEQMSSENKKTINNNQTERLPSQWQI